MNMKRILGLVLAFVLVVSCLPVSAFADNGLVAKIGDVDYASLADAVAAAQNGDTITLVSDFDLTATVNFNKELTLDLNGHTITGTDNTTANFGLLNNTGDLTIIDSVGTGKATLVATTNSGWNRYSAVISNNPGGNLTINGGTFEHLGGTDMAYGIDSLTNGNLGDVSVTINAGSIVSPYRAVRQFANSVSCTNALTINGGTVSGANKSVWLQGASAKANIGTLSISESADIQGDVYLWVGGSDMASASGLTIDIDADVNIVNGLPEGYSINAEGGKQTLEYKAALPTATVTEIENGKLTFAMNFKADAATNDQLAYYGDWYADFVLTINKEVTFNADGSADGYLSGQYDSWSANWVNVPTTSVTHPANEPIKVMEFAAGLLGKKGLKYTYAEVYNTVKDFDCGVFFSPEFLAANPDLEVTLELRAYNPANEAENYLIGDTYVFVSNPVAKIGINSYASLADAVAAAKDGDTITLVADFALDSTVNFNKELTLDLNGHTITGTDNTTANFGLLNNTGDLTIIDSVGTGNVTLVATTNSGWNRYSAVISNNPGGNLTINGGTFEHLGGTDMAYGIDSLTNGNLGDVSVTINDGSIVSPYRAVRQFANSVSCTNALTINGGTVSGANKSVWLQGASAKANIGTLSISEDADIQGDVYLWVGGSDMTSASGLTIDISTEANIVNGLPEGYSINAEGGKQTLEYKAPLPTATVTEIENDKLTFAMNFKVDAATNDQLAYYGDWYADFVLTINKEVTFNADGSTDGYLSGQYDSWSANWVNVPTTSVTHPANEPIKVMEFAAGLLGKKGLKYTYAEVYNTVKDFDCGIFFSPEFLAANPDLEVTLELRIYNPADESESYSIGEVYTFTNPVEFVAKNIDTNVSYADVLDAIYEAEAGQTVILLKSLEVREISVYEDITLDLNGYSLTTKYANVYGDIIDSSESNAGRLVVDAKRVMFRNNNAQIPMLTSDGYAFVEIVKFNIRMLNSGKLAFQPFFEDYGRQLMTAGATATGVSIQVKLEWVKGTEILSQVATYNETMVNGFFDSYKSNNTYGMTFTLTVSNPENYENLTFTAVISSCSVVYEQTP